MDLNKVNYSNLIISILILFAAGYIYDKFKINIDKNDKVHELNIIKKYLLNSQPNFTIEQLSSIKKPILWLHIEYTKNSRNWESFGSRNSYDLNQDYLYLTMRSIITKCSDYFHIVIVDDDSFKLLLENWSIDLNKISDPQKKYFRTLGLMKLLYNYGGLYIESSFILFKNLKPIYDNILATGKMTVGEFPNKSSNSHVMHYMPSTKLIGCNKQCNKMSEFINHLEIILSKDYTNEINVEDLINKWLFNNNKTINTIDGTYIGVKNSKNKIINLEDLIGNTYLELNDKSYGLYIPKDELMIRNNYNWFIYLNSKEVLESNTNIGKYLLMFNN